jgi:putative heme-binding domain-containing protein
LRDGLIHAIYGGVYGKPHEDVVEGHPRTGDLMPMLAHLGPAAPCGIVRYSSRNFGDEFRDNLFLCCFNLHKIMRHVLVPNGSTYTTQDSDFLVSDNTDFHPTDILEDADGSLLVVDTGGWYKLCCPTSQLHKPDVLGAVYRIRRSGAPKVEDPRGLKLDIASLAASKAAELLGDERRVVRLRTTARLAQLGDAAVPELTRVLRNSKDVETRCRAVWALTQIDTSAAHAAVCAALDDADPGVRHTAAQSVSLWRDAAARDRLVAMLGKESPTLQRLAAEALGRIGDKSAVPAILARINGETDRALEHSLIYALIELANREATLEGLSSKNPHTQRAALLALEQMPGGGLEAKQVTTLLGATDKALRDSAWWVAGRHPEWSEEFVGVLKTRLSGAEANDPDLVRALAQSASREPIQRLLVTTVHDPALPKASRLSALRAMTQSGLRKTPDGWLDEILCVLREPDAELAAEAVAASRTLTIPKERGDPLFAGLMTLGSDARQPADLRLAALTAIPPGGFVIDVAIDAELFAFLRGQLAPGKPPLARTTAATLFGNAKINREQATELAGALPAASPLEIARLLPAFENVSDESVSLKVLEALEKSKAVESVPAEKIKSWLTKCPASMQARGVELLNRLGVDPAKQKAHLGELAAKIKDGDIRRGQAVFNNPKSGCVTCHSVGYVGGNFGPDLSRIGTVRNESDLLEAIVYPSASFVRSYEPYVAVTKTGEQMGLLRKDASDEVVLAPGPGVETRLARSDVVELRPGTISAMPQGYDQILNPQELADLIVFLKATH